MDSHFYEADAVKAAPDLSTLASEGYPTDGSPELGTPATLPGAAWFYAIGEEIRNAIVALGLDPEKLDPKQMGAGLTALISRVKQLEDDLALGAFKTGDIKQSLSATVPDGWLICNGAAVSRETYKDLWEFANDNRLVRPADAIADISTSTDLVFGPGDGSTTFSLPDARGRVLQGVATGGTLGAYVPAGLPNITGAINNGAGAFIYNEGLGAFSVGLDRQMRIVNEFNMNPNSAAFSFGASRSNALYGANSTVQMPATAVQYLIKY